MLVEIASPRRRLRSVRQYRNVRNLVENITLKFGDKASPAHCAKALQIVEGMRANSLGKPQKPKNIV